MSDYPAAVDSLHAHRVGGGRGRAPGQGLPLPGKTIAEAAAPSPCGVAPGRQVQLYVQYEIFGGGGGRRNGKDGASATSFHLSNGKIAPVAIIESDFSTQIERFELLPNSGGPGRHRRSVGFVHEYRIFQDEVRFSMRTDKHALAPQGVDRGHSGGTRRCIINPRAKDERSMPSHFGDQRLKTGAVLRVERPGGGGVAAAFERSPEAVLEDLRQGYVSVERARSDYGVAVCLKASDVNLKSDATGKLRLCG